MTEYGRGRGSEPWHPDDPLYAPGYGQEGRDGYAGWDGQQAAGDPGPYGGRQEYPQQQYAQQHPQQHPQWEGTPGQYPGQQQYPQAGCPEQGYGWDGSPDPGQGYGQGDPYGQQPGPYGYQQPSYDDRQYDRQYAQQHPYDPHAHDPYGPQAYDPQPYGQGPQGHQQYEPQPGDPRQPQGPGPAGEWPQEPDGPEHAFFADQPDNAHRRGGRGGHDERDRAAHDDHGRGDYERDDHPDADDRDDDDDRDPGRRGGKPKKRRSGMACLLVTVVLAGGLGGAGYFAYDFYQSRFGPAPDYSGEGSGTAQVEIPAGAGLGEMGRILKAAGVVKSAQAFVDAAGGKPIQAGVYSLKKEMSGEAAVALMLSPESRNALIIPEGTRNAQVYALIDDQLGLKKGTTEQVAEEQAGKLGLPEWADDNGEIKDPLEGFLYPARYDAGEGAKPADILKKMVSRAKAEYAEHDLEGQAAELNLDTPLQLLTVASLVQAEGKTRDDFGKMARVVYNRLEPGNTETNGKIQFDSSYNYLKGQSEIDISLEEIRSDDDPYNTYYHAGLPPGPIGNPGEQALDAAVNPEAGDWYYFVSVDGENTKFAETHEEHQKLVEELNANRKNKD